MRQARPLLRAPQSDAIPALDFGTAFFAAQAGRGEDVAVIDETGPITGAEFFDLTRAVAGRLVNEGVGPETRVAILAYNSANYLACYAAILLTGACVVPLPTSATPEVLARMMDDSGAAMLFHDMPFATTAATLLPEMTVALETLADWAGDYRLDAPITPPADAYFDLIYSSGTTGAPKGIVHDHRFRGRQLERMPRFGLDGEARLLVSTPLYSNTTLVAALPVLAKGGMIVTMARFDTKRFLELSETHAISHAMLVPVQYMRLMGFDGFDSYDLSAYRAKMSTSAPLPAPLKRDVLNRWPGGLYEVYGMTEGGVSTVLDCATYPDKLHTVGKPAEGCDARIIDDAGQEVAPGEFGEIVGRSGSMMPGYLNADDKTRDVLWQSPEGLDFIRTGDMGRFDEDGFLHLMDRRKDMILSGGFNIFAADLEAVLRGHPMVADVAVIAVPSKDWGETPLGLVVMHPGADMTEADLRDWANGQLGKTQRLSAIEFRTDLPRNAIGKIEKRALRLPYWEDTGG